MEYLEDTQDFDEDDLPGVIPLDYALKKLMTKSMNLL